MILKPGPDPLPHMFLKGFRAPVGGTDNISPVGEEVGVFVARQVIGIDGQPRVPGDVLDADEPFVPPDKPEGPFRFESELATAKPELDVVIVDDLDNFLNAADIANPDVANIIVGKLFGDVRIDTGGGFGPAIGRHLGWWPRGETPRKELAGRATPAGDAAALESFDAQQFKLPARYFNAFNAGNPVAGQAPLSTGDRLRFEPDVGSAFEATIPAGPDLAVSQDDEPLDPPLVLSPQVDTVVFDRTAASLTFVWRAVFPWQARYETATLEVN